MKIFVCLSLLGIFGLSEYSQCESSEKPDSLKILLTQVKKSDCPDMIFNAVILIPYLYERARLDSIEIILQYLEEECSDDFFDPLRNLMKIKQHGLDSNWCDSTIVFDLLREYSRHYFSFNTSFFYELRYRPEVVDTRTFLYDTFIVNLAGELAELHDEGTISQLVCLYYSKKSGEILKRLHENVYEGSCFQLEYDEKLARLIESHEKEGVHYNLTAGLWRPMGDNQLLGNKPTIGGQLGWRGKNFGLDLTLQLRYLKSKEEYQIFYKGGLVSTDRFFGTLFGLDLVYQPIKVNPFCLELIVGFGYDGFSAYSQGDEHDAVNAFNLNVGIKPRLFINNENTKYLGLLVRHNFVDYTTHGGTDLSGNTISFEIVYGWIKSVHLAELRKLHHFD